MKILNFLILALLGFLSGLKAQTPDFIELQGYLYDASYLTGNSDIGLGIENVWSLPGGMGEYVNIVDVEQGWNLNHEDLPSGIQLIHGQMSPNKDHGTAVIGILVRQDNGFGVTGICPLASVNVYSRYLDEGTLL